MGVTRKLGVESCSCCNGISEVGLMHQQEIVSTFREFCQYLVEPIRLLADIVHTCKM